LHDPDVEGFRQGLRELGHVEGQNLPAVPSTKCGHEFWPQ
jgi:hypothetical protein